LDFEMVKKLVELGANVLATNSKGEKAIECVGLLETSQEEELERANPQDPLKKDREEEDEEFQNLKSEKRKTRFYDSDDEDEEELQAQVFRGYGGNSEEEQAAAAQAIRSRLKDAEESHGAEGLEAGDLLISRRAFVLPAVSVEELEDPAGLGRKLWDVKGQLKLNREDSQPRNTAKIWVGGGWKKVFARYKKHERSNSRFHGAGVGGEQVTGLNMPGPGYNWPQVMDANSRGSRLSTRALRFTNKQLGAKAPREPEGFSFGGRSSPYPYSLPPLLYSLTLNPTPYLLPLTN